MPLVELATRWDYADPSDSHGHRRDLPDRPLHSTALFGASKLAADVMVQEYGRYFGMPTGMLPWRLPDRPQPFRRRAARVPRLPGRGPSGRAAPTASTATRASRSATTSIPSTCAPPSWSFTRRRDPAAVYNLGGGRANSVSDPRGDRTRPGPPGRRLTVEYVETSRVGDHVTYISDLRKWRADYPGLAHHSLARRHLPRAGRALGYCSTYWIVWSVPWPSPWTPGAAGSSGRSWPSTSGSPGSWPTTSSSGTTSCSPSTSHGSRPYRMSGPSSRREWSRLPPPFTC